MKKFEELKISYRGTYVCSKGHWYEQRIKISKKTFNFFIKKIKEKIQKGLETYDCTMVPNVGKYSKKEYPLNISTATFIKSLLPNELQKRFKLDVNTYLFIEDGKKEKIYFRV